MTQTTGVHQCLSCTCIGVNRFIASLTNRKDISMTDNRPAFTIRGTPGTGLKLTLWKHDSDNGPWYSAGVSRSYKDGEQWKESASISQQDFLEVAEMFREAHAWVREQARNRPVQQSQDAEPVTLAERETERKRAGGRRH
jgi:hypothetical protein